MSESENPGGALCHNCGRQFAEHHPANYADGPLVGRRLEVCPTAVFVSRQGEKHPLEKGGVDAPRE